MPRGPLQRPMGAANGNSNGFGVQRHARSPTNADGRVATAQSVHSTSTSACKPVGFNLR